MVYHLLLIPEPGSLYLFDTDLADVQYYVCCVIIRWVMYFIEQLLFHCLFRTILPVSSALVIIMDPSSFISAIGKPTSAKLGTSL